MAQRFGKLGQGNSKPVEDLVQSVARGNVTEVKVVLASLVAALAVYQVTLMAAGYGKLRLPFLAPRPASAAHRAIGDTVVLVTVAVAVMCVSYFELEDNSLHIAVAIALLAVLSLKIIVVRWWHAMSRFLPVIGVTVFTLFIAVWLTAAAEHVTG
jgi:hypothetical protein